MAATGQTVQAERDVLARIDEAGTRLIVATDTDGSARIPPDAVTRVAALSKVEWVFGVGFARDGSNAAIGAGGLPAAVRTVWGDLPDIIDVNGRLSRSGEALAGTMAAETLGLALRVGGIDTGETQIFVVGGFVAHHPFDGLNTSLLAAPDNTSTTETLRTVCVLAEAPVTVAAVAVLAAGLILPTLITYTSVTARRQDFGRRRALGARRGTITGLVVTQTVIVTTIAENAMDTRDSAESPNDARLPASDRSG